MNEHLPLIPARYFAHLTQILRLAGVDTNALLRATGIATQLLEHPDGHLPLPQAERFLADAIRTCGRADIGFDLGERLRISSHNVVGYGLLTSSSVDAAMSFMARFFSLITPAISMRYRRTDGEVSVEFVPALPLSHDSLLVHLEAVLMATHGILRELFDERVPRHQIYLGYPAPPHAARYRRIKGATCHFDVDQRSGVAMLFPASEFDRIPKLADTVAFKAAELRCVALLDRAATGKKMADWIRMMLRESTSRRPSLKEFAQMLRMSTRTLNRRLRDEGCEYRALQHDVAFERACRTLSTSQISITQIAHSLGYNDVSNFTRAFRRNFGLSPSLFRKRHYSSNNS